MRAHRQSGADNGNDQGAEIQPKVFTRTLLKGRGENRKGNGTRRGKGKQGQLDRKKDRKKQKRQYTEASMLKT